jgi:hypothetical protein
MIDAVRSARVAERLNQLIPGSVIDDRHTRTHTPFEGRERITPARRGPLVSGNCRHPPEGAEVHELVLEASRVNDRQLRRHRAETDR